MKARAIKISPPKRQKLPFRRAESISASLLAGAFLSSLIPAGLTAQLSFLILFVLGLVKLFESPSRFTSGSR